MKKRFKLRVETGAPSAEIAVIGPDFELRKRALGSLDASLSAGIYTVKVRLGRESQERHVVLDQNANLQFSPESALASPVPIFGTARSHEYQAYGAAEQSARVHERLGAGAEIFLCARYWSHHADIAAQRRLQKAPHPAKGLRLYKCGKSGEREFVSFAAAGFVSRANDPWSACTIAVDPGAYEIGWSGEERGAEYRFSVIASPDWQTQVFVRRRADEATKAFQAKALSDVALAMRKPSTQQAAALLEPDWQDYVLMDSARVALAQGRMLMSDTLANLFLRKFDDPMLGLLGAHLLLQAKTLEAAEKSGRRRSRTRIDPGGVLSDRNLFTTAIGNLRALLGPAHPDVEALALRNEATRGQEVFEAAPMLRASWNLMVAESHEREQAVSLGLWKRVALVTDLGPYLIWAHNGARKRALPPALRENVKAALRQQLPSPPAARRRMSAAKAARDEGSALRAIDPRWAAAALNVPMSAARAILAELG